MPWERGLFFILITFSFSTSFPSKRAWQDLYQIFKECWFSFFLMMIDVDVTFRGRCWTVKYVDIFNSCTWKAASPRRWHAVDDPQSNNKYLLFAYYLGSFKTPSHRLLVRYTKCLWIFVDKENSAPICSKGLPQKIPVFSFFFNWFLKMCVFCF